MSDNENQDYGRFLDVTKKSIRSHQLEALRAVSRELVALYWEIGKAIQKKQEQLGWGKALVETLAKDLQAEFPGRNGFSARNLWDMKNLYASYASALKLRRIVAVLGGGVNLLIMRRCQEVLEREFFCVPQLAMGWQVVPSCRSCRKIIVTSCLAPKRLRHDWRVWITGGLEAVGHRLCRG